MMRERYGTDAPRVRLTIGTSIYAICPKSYVRTKLAHPGIF